MNRKRIMREVLDLVIVTFGVAIYSVALTVFLVPNEVSPGGVTGLAAVIGDLIHQPIGLITIALNLPLIIWGFVKIGTAFIIRTSYATFIMSVLIDVSDALLPAYSGNRLLAALYGGFLAGIGLALVFLRGSSTGGTDIAAKILSNKFPRFSMGRMVLILDAVVIIIASVAYQSFETALYTMLTIFISSKVIDEIIYGADKGKLIFVVTKEPDRIKQAIYDSVGRGVTIIPAKGGYSDTDRAVVMCAVRINEAAKLHRAVADADKESFIMIGEAGEISGEGFEKNN